MLGSQTRITVQVDGDNLGVFTYKSGGQTSAEDTKHWPGSMQPQIALGGPASVENVTVRKLWDPELRGKTARLRAKAGKASMTIVVQPLDADGLPQGSPEVYRGILTRVMAPESDAATAEAAFLELECSTHGSVG